MEETIGKESPISSKATGFFRRLIIIFIFCAVTYHGYTHRFTKFHVIGLILISYKSGGMRKLLFLTTFLIFIFLYLPNLLSAIFYGFIDSWSSKFAEKTGYNKNAFKFFKRFGDSSWISNISKFASSFNGFSNFTSFFGSKTNMPSTKSKSSTSENQFGKKVYDFKLSKNQKKNNICADEDSKSKYAFPDVKRSWNRLIGQDISETSDENSSEKEFSEDDANNTDNDNEWYLEETDCEYSSDSIIC